MAYGRRHPATDTAARAAAAVTLQLARTLAGVDPAQWDALAGDHPFLCHAYLHALHESRCASAQTGWDPHYLLLEDGGRLAAAMPLYLKSHSYGEYVFDWAWAEAYARHGLDYYPKLVAAVPFTPVPGPRLLATTDAQRTVLIAAARELAGELGASSLHVLFPPPAEAGLLQAGGLMLRQGVQFHWSNHGYADFTAFLAGMSHDKRKKIRQERRRSGDAGITFDWREGRDITAADWRFFIRCYNNTYRAHHSTPYLNLDFFSRIGQAMPDNLALFVARRDGSAVAASLCLRSRTRLYGRYWGAVEFVPGLHFEACYYQPLEYCIARGLQAFEGGAQGEHKIARGLLPVPTVSAHWLAHAEFASAVGDFLAREGRGMARYVDELNERSPFRADAPLRGIDPP